MTALFLLLKKRSNQSVACLATCSKVPDSSKRCVAPGIIASFFFFCIFGSPFSAS